MPRINKTKKVNIPNKDKSKIKKGKSILCLKTNNKTRQIICLFVCSRYNFHYLKRLFINILGDKIKSNVALWTLELSLGLINIFPKSTVCAKTFLIFFKKSQSKLHKVFSKWFLLLKNCRKCSRKDFVEST